ncbi:MAG: NAD(P)-binding oxidoreductase [Pseudomonadota bacterium]
MKIALLGATGGTGKSIIEQALSAGHQVSALVRDVSKLSSQDGLTITQGDARDGHAVSAVINGADAVISTLGNFNRKPNTEVSDAAKVFVTAMEETGPKRLVVVTTIGVGDSYKPLKSPMFKYVVIGWVARHIWKDRERQEAVIEASSLDWTIVRPGGLTDAPHTGQYQVVDGGAAQPKKISIGRADVADFCLKALKDDTYAGRKAVCVFY